MTTRRDEALARLAQELQVPPHLLNLYPPAANHWTALLPEGWRVGIVSRGRRWGATQAMDDWRARAWSHYAQLWADMDYRLARGWEALYEGKPSAPDDSGDRCYPGAYPCTPPPCPPWPRALDQPDPCSIGDCLTCPGYVVGCGCRCHYGDDEGWLVP